MSSTLYITKVDKLQKEIIKSVKKETNKSGIYISLNKTQKSTEESLKKENIKTEKIFFIDCVTKEKTRDDVLHINPDQLETLSEAIKEFVKDIKGEKYLIIDAISTLLIYNSENKVAQFVKNVTDLRDQHDLTIIAYSPETKGEELLNKIFNFFDKVKK